MEDKYCVRCMEDFEVSKIKPFQMGYNYPLEMMPKSIQNKFRDISDEEMFLCGNCYFDLTDE